VNKVLAKKQAKIFIVKRPVDSVRVVIMNVICSWFDFNGLLVTVEVSGMISELEGL
jgi:hypothetical protein